MQKVHLLLTCVTQECYFLSSLFLSLSGNRQGGRGEGLQFKRGAGWVWIRKKNFPRGYMNVFCQVTNGSLIYSQIIDYFTTVVTSDHFICSCILIFFLLLLFQEIHQLRARIFTLENELDRLKVQALEKEQLSKQVKWVSYFAFVHSKKIFI